MTKIWSKRMMVCKGRSHVKMSPVLLWTETNKNINGQSQLKTEAEQIFLLPLKMCMEHAVNVTAWHWQIDDDRDKVLVTKLKAFVCF